MSFHVEHFGCRAARADGEAVSDMLRSAGLSERSPSSADVVVVNTCSVTAEADRAARAFIRRAHRLNPAARILVTGCYAQRAPEELASLPGVAAVVGNSHKALAPAIALQLSGAESQHAQTQSPATVSVQSLLANANPAHQTLILADDRFAHSFLEEAQLMPGAQTRPNLKIQEGCGNRCSFCVIPQTRGSSRSLSAATVLRQVRGFVAAGGNELVFSGINLGRWGSDLASTPGAPRPTLPWLVRQIFEQTDLPRLRLSSIEPMDWDADLIALMAEFGGGIPGPPATGLRRWGGRLACHAHLPLQSGSDAVLRRMHRRYRPWHYADKVHALIRAAGPGLTLGADVMAGFPGETEREFEETLEFIRALPFGYLHLFPFSPRPGTRAWALHAAQPVPPAAVEERMAALRTLAAEKSATHRRYFLGRELDAITLHTPPALASLDRTSALTENFLPVELAAQLPANRLVRLHITGFTPEGALQAVEAAQVAAPVPAAPQLLGLR
ncbi:MAG: MiaB/RimO family radical SAM methylthiotransferase [Acidobacteriota bacterium]|nr:MiaB/RimO family radical SAM methylthiotransferase [Acidobacteriota bacterium]